MSNPKTAPTPKVPAVYGTSEEVADRNRFFASRIRKVQRTWRRKHERAVEDALAAGKGYDQEEAEAIAAAKWGASEPTGAEARAVCVEDMRTRIAEGAGGRLDVILANELAARSED